MLATALRDGWKQHWNFWIGTKNKNIPTRY